MSSYDATSSTADVIDGISLAGRLALVTGASSGLGVETARTLAGAGAGVIMSARDPDKLQAAVEEVRAAEPAAEVGSLLMDLSDLDSVRAAAQDAVRTYGALHLLVNNAGVMACPLMRTAQGFEMQFGTNHLGHFLFTCLLAPALLAGAPGRVVNLSSGGHRFANINLDDPNYRERDYDKWQAYGESKTANALFTVALDRRLAPHGVRAFAVHPGVIMTGLARHMDEADFATLQARSRSPDALALKTVEQGAATSVWAATAPELEGKGGIYLENCQIAEKAAPDSSAGVESYALDAAAAERLWALSEQLVEQTFAFD
ncbi:MAG: short-chain dehydrogenase [Halioglobus sp.]|mgnify:CR=1 FL=1|nr:short-chain dehydrogenase [Halioglobus sp.]|tara:strand:- start:1964 stop:2914 length:951 start_codon:yes stop_codon:yes gene_type:complete